MKLEASRAALSKMSEIGAEGFAMHAGFEFNFKHDKYFLGASFVLDIFETCKKSSFVVIYMSHD